MGLCGYSRVGFRGFAGVGLLRSPGQTMRRLPQTRLRTPPPRLPCSIRPASGLNTPAKPCPTHHSPPVTRYPPLPASTCTSKAMCIAGRRGAGPASEGREVSMRDAGKPVYRKPAAAAPRPGRARTAPLLAPNPVNFVNPV